MKARRTTARFEPGTPALTLRERYLRENEDEMGHYITTYRHEKRDLA
jgi:hypothetical protein